MTPHSAISLTLFAMYPTLLSHCLIHTCILRIHYIDIKHSLLNWLMFSRVQVQNTRSYSSGRWIKSGRSISVCSGRKTKGRNARWRYFERERGWHKRRREDQRETESLECKAGCYTRTMKNEPANWATRRKGSRIWKTHQKSKGWRRATPTLVADLRSRRCDSIHQSAECSSFCTAKNYRRSEAPSGRIQRKIIKYTEGMFWMFRRWKFRYEKIHI